MWAFILMAVLVVIAIVAVALRPHLDGLEKGLIIAGILILSPFLWFLAYPLAQATGGMIPDYSNGVREGYITKISKKGIFWKTWEAEMQVGSGELSALQGSFAFSLRDEDMVKRARENLGKRVMLEYRQWLLMPYSVGDSGYEAKEIALHPAEKK